MKLKKGFLKDTLIVFSGTGTSQIISILATPIITRFYNPDTFGVAAIFLAITGILSVIICLRYELAIILPREIENAIAVFWICIIISSLISLIILIIFLSFGDYLLNLANTPSLNNYIYYIPLFTFIFGIFTALNYWYIRNKLFSLTSSAQICNSLSNNSLKICFAFFGKTGPLGLICSETLGRLSGTFLLIRRIIIKDSKILITNFNFKLIKQNFISFNRMAILNMPSSLINIISQKIPTVLLAFFFSSTIVGLYELSYRILKIPSQIIGESIRNVFFQYASSSNNKTNSISNDVSKTLVILLYLGLGPFVVLFIISPYIFGLFFGNNWIEAGTYSRWLTPWLLTSFLTTPISSVISIINKEKIGLKYQSSLFISRLIGFIICGHFFNDPLLTIIIFSIIGVIFQIYLLRWILKESMCYIRNLDIKKHIIIISILLVITIIVLEKIFILNIFWITASCLIYIIYYILSFKKEIITFYRET